MRKIRMPQWMYDECRARADACKLPSVAEAARRALRQYERGRGSNAPPEQFATPRDSPAVTLGPDQWPSLTDHELRVRIAAVLAELPPLAGARLSFAERPGVDYIEEPAQ